MASEPEPTLDEIERAVRDALAQLETALHDCTDPERGASDEVRALGQFDLSSAQLESVLETFDSALPGVSTAGPVDFNNLLRRSLDRSIPELRVPIRFEMALSEEPMRIELPEAFRATMLLDRALGIVLRAVDAGDCLSIELAPDGVDVVLSMTIDGDQRTGTRRIDSSSRRATLEQVAGDLGARIDLDDRTMKLRFPRALDGSKPRS